MNVEEYAAAQAAISAAVARYTLQFGKLFAKPALSLADWLSFLQFLFPQIEAQRYAAAGLGREFYDSQRKLYLPSQARHDQHLETYSFERFIKDMDPARERMSRVDAGDDATHLVALQAMRSVENAGRQQIIHAVEDDPSTPQTHEVKGWARVATGRETCEWCLMLVSRGPVYSGAESAGLELSDGKAVELHNSGEDVSAYMQQWHAGCDCKVVPVFKLEQWPGKAAQERALELWNAATREAISLEDDPGVHTHGKSKGQQFTRNQLALNALRRKLERGQINPAEYAGLAA